MNIGRPGPKSKNISGTVPQKLRQREALQEHLKSEAPKLAKNMAGSAEDPKWDRRLSEFRRAWNSARARAWIDRLSDPEEDHRLRLALDAQRKRIRKTLELTAGKAWGHCFRRMTEHQTQHLIAWSIATGNVGGGTGRYAPLHRQAAREHMQECRGAIPAWIMPLYRVVELIQPGKERYDLVINDEASQSEPEAVLLTYLAAKIVVVGDDKQISPQFVGIDRGRRHSAPLAPHPVPAA